MTILYFTATGNSLFAAKQIGGNLVSIPQAMKQNTLRFQDDAIGIVFPVYGLCVPPLIQNFLAKATLESKYLFALLTYGFYDGGAVRQLVHFGAAHDLSFSYLNTWKTAENYLPGFDMEKEKKADRTKQQKALASVAKDIGARRVWSKHNTALDRFMTWTHAKHYAYPCGAGVTKQFHIADNCCACGTCAQVCPMDNIRLADGKPVFSTRCISCLACTHNCPQNAIRLSSEKSESRYRHPEITLQELLEANW